MKTKLIVFAALALLVIAGVSFAQGRTDSAAVAETISCPQSVVSGLEEVEGETVVCGTVTVPANYDDPDGSTIDLTYGILKSTSLSPAADPVIYLHGGPGEAELTELTQTLRNKFATLRERRDVIVFDQRGTGYSPGEVECSAAYAGGYDEAAERVQNEGFEGLEVAGEVQNVLMETCVEALEENDVDLSVYNTINNARDVAALADALGHDTYNLYGLSYGTKLGSEVIRQNPPGVRSVILDSVITPEVKFYEQMPEANEESFVNIYNMCLADEACAEAYPDLIERLNGLFEQLDEEPILLDDGSEISSESLAALLTNSANLQTGVWQVPYFPRLIHELEQGMTDTWSGLYDYSLIPSETTNRFTAPSSDIPFSARRMLNTANDLARQSESLDNSAQKVAAQALELVEETDMTPTNLFIRTLDERRDTPYNAFEDYNYRVEFVSLPLQEASPAMLEAFITNHFEGVDETILLDVVDQMSEEDVQELYDRMRTDERAANLLFELNFALHLYVCNEDVPYNTIEGVQEYAENYQIPGLTRREIGKTTQVLEACDVFPAGTAPESFHDPIMGDGSIPIIVFSGTNDTQTATSWAKEAADQFIGSQYVNFPNAGHGAINFSQCAQDIAAAFMDNPETEVNASCTAELVPQFVLPDDPLVPLS